MCLTKIAAKSSREAAETFCNIRPEERRAATCTRMHLAVHYTYFYLLIDKRISCDGSTELFGNGAKFLSENGLICLVREGTTVRKYHYGVESVVSNFRL